MFAIALTIVLITIIAAHLIYKVYDVYNPPHLGIDNYLVNYRRILHKRQKKKNRPEFPKKDGKKEGFWGELPGRDMHQGSFDDPRNRRGRLGREMPTGDIEDKKTAMRSIEAVLAATGKINSTTEPGENRTADQIFVFHDELEGVKASISNRKVGNIWTPTEFLSQLKTEGYRNL
jgi:hypothetical protein